MTKILVTGANGQVGSEIKSIANTYPQYDFVFVDRNQMPLDQLEAIATVLDNIQPDIIINAAAYTAVDKAETEKTLADQVNHVAVTEMAKWAAKNHCKVLHISTDYVFDGSSQSPIKEDQTTQPINWYGTTKLKGEQALLQHAPDSIIIRTAWVYSQYGNNFVKTMLRVMGEKPSINVVNDQIGAPTAAHDLAGALMKIVDSENWVPGIYNFTNKGEISWYDFATAINEMARVNCIVNPVSSDQFPTPAQRPKYSLLDTAKIQDTYKLSIPTWRNSLQVVINQLL